MSEYDGGGYLKPGLTEVTNDSGERVLHINPWHRAYCKWYRNNRSGNTRRAAVWGWIADRIVG